MRVTIMEKYKNVEWSLMKVGKVVKKMLKEIDKDENVVYNIWKDNKIVAVMISYKKYKHE